MAFVVKALFRWNQSLKNADIIVLRNVLAIFSEFFSRYREILPSTIYMPNFRSIGTFKEKLRRRGGGGGGVLSIGYLIQNNSVISCQKQIELGTCW